MPSDGGGISQATPLYCSLDPKPELSQSGTGCTLRSGLEGTEAGCLVTGQNQLFSFHTFLGCFKEVRSAQYYHLGAGQGISKAKKRTRKLFTLQYTIAQPCR